jgi:hypothetical protein
MPADKRLEFRAGINIGDVIEDGGDIFGDGVNVAARLENIADRGGICISRQVLDQIDGKLRLGMRELGRQNLKNISRPIEIYAIAIDEDGAFPSSRVLEAASLKQAVKYCKTPDGVRLAYATVGSGPPLVRTAHWLGHLEYDWELPIFRHLLSLRCSIPGPCFPADSIRRFSNGTHEATRDHRCRSRTSFSTEDSHETGVGF